MTDMPPYTTMIARFTALRCLSLTNTEELKSEDVSFSVAYVELSPVQY